MNKPIYIGLLGLGTVGSGVEKLLAKNAAAIEKKVGSPIKIKTILVRSLDKHADSSREARLTTNADDILNDEDIKIVVEVMGGICPAKEYMLRALDAGKYVVTANKDVIAEYGRELFTSAAGNNADFLFEASVGGGIPIIRPLKQCLAANNINTVMGIVNGTTNYMLTKMAHDKMSFDAVLAEAQAQGYAEADPAADVCGYDAARKIAILASIAFGTRVSLGDVYVEGITDISLEDIEYAEEIGYVIKLLAIAKQDEDGVGISVRVHPVFLPKTHPLAAVNDVYNAIYIKGDAVGETMFYGRGAGQMPTASAVVADIIDEARDIKHNIAGRILCTCFAERPIYSIEKTKSPFYVRLLVLDQPGVLAAIAAAFGAQCVSLETVVQKRKVKDHAELVLITYCVPEVNMRLALETLRGMSVVSKVCNVIRVEDGLDK